MKHIHLIQQAGTTTATAEAITAILPGLQTTTILIHLQGAAHLQEALLPTAHHHEAAAEEALAAEDPVVAEAVALAEAVEAAEEDNS